MNTAINIHNYEEYFLLYVDNELSAAERKAVDAFVLAHPDLAVELDMLRQAQLSDDSVFFEDKQSLYRSESNEISLSNYEEQFLLFVDDELTPGAKDKVERFVLQHPELQEGFTQLKQTRLPAEQVVFKNKELLYRKEEKERRVVFMSWQRLAVAAAFIGAVALVWMVLPGKQGAQERLAAAGDPIKNTTSAGVAPQEVKPTGVEKNAVASAPETKETNNAPVLLADNRRQLNTTVGANTTVNGKATNTPTTAQSVETGNLIAYNEPPARTEAKIEPVAAENHNSFATVPATTQKVPNEHTVVLAANTNNEAMGGPNNIEAQPAVYRELDTDSEDEKKSLLLGSLEINKDKLRGFFRKAGSLFRSKAKAAEDERTESRPSSNTRSLK